jgi:hypothetical protein
VNEIQRVYWGSAASPVASSLIESGTFTITYDGETTSAIAFDADAAAIVAALEALSNVGVGDVVVTLTANGFTIEFQGALANTNVAAVTVDQSLKQKADTVTIVETQVGSAGTPTNPSNSTTTAAVSQVNEVQLINLNSATTGGFTLNCSGYGSSSVSSLDSTGITTAVANIFGGPHANVNDNFNGTFTVTFVTNLAGTPMPEMTISSDTTDGSGVSVSTTTQGVAGVAQVDTCTFSTGNAIGGSWTFNGNSIAFDGTPRLFGSTVTGSASAGSLVTTWNDFDPHSPASVSNSGELVSAGGQHHQFTITLSDAPTEGHWTLKFNGDSPVGDLTFDDVYQNVATFVATAVGGSWFGIGSAGGPWVIESSGDISDPGTLTGEDRGSQNEHLRKALASVDVVTVQEGVTAASGGARILTLGCG